MTQNDNAHLSPSKPRASAQDFFLHLLAMVTLYFSAISFLTIIFQIINTFIPDILAEGYSTSARLGKLRFGISSVIIVFPVYLGTMWYLARRYAIDPLRKNLGIRKWLIWFTLFVAVLIMIGDSVALVNNLLSGELKARFILKALSILFVTGAIFGYYLWDLRRQKTLE